MKTFLFVAVLFLQSMICSAYTSGVGGWVCESPTVRMYMGTYIQSSDGKDSNDQPYPKQILDWATAFYHENGVDGWDGDTGFYLSDIRSPLTVGQTKTWTFYVWYPRGDGDCYAAIFAWWIPPGRDPRLSAKLELVQKPAGVTGGPALATAWTDPPDWLTLPLYPASDDPFAGYAFRFTMTMVPEPSSLLALCAGLVSAGAMWRRRRRQF